MRNPEEADSIAWELDQSEIQRYTTVDEALRAAEE